MPQLAQAGKFLSFKRMTASFLVNVVTKKEASEKCKDGSRLSISDKCSLHDVNVVQNSCYHIKTVKLYKKDSKVCSHLQVVSLSISSNS